MNSKFKKVLIVLAAVLVVLTACTPAPTEEPTQAVPPTEAPTEAPEPTAEPTAIPTETPEPTEEPITVTDGLGEQITLDEPAGRIVSISPSLTESLFALGAGGRIVGRDSNSTYPEAAQDIQDLGNMYSGLPVEDIVALEPDLVVAAQIIAPDQIQELRDLGLNVYWQENPADFEGLYENLGALSKLVGQEEQADELITRLKDRVAAVDSQLEDVEARPIVFYELDATDPANPYTVGEGTFVSFVINRAKAINVGDELAGSYIQISSEEILQQDPEIILLSDALYGESAETVSQRAGWEQITAVKEGNIYPFDPFLLSVPGPRLVEGYEQLAELLHPEEVEIN
jgi:iron complex transport system substrate-binding protein